MIRKILVPVRGDGEGDNVLAHAAAVAKRFNAHIAITHCRARPEDLMPYGVPIPAFLKTQLLDQASLLADQEESGLKDEVGVLTAKLGLTLSDDWSKDAATASWHEEAGRQVDVIKRHGRLADLICVAKPDVDRNLGTNTLKAALFHTGRPVMMCPQTDAVPQTIGDHIAIGWNGSKESASAVALSLDLISAASKVTVLTAGEEVHGAGSQELLIYLSMRGITAEIRKFDAGASLGDSLLNAVKEVGADLLIMGAYGQSHEAETFFGGNTQTVVDNATAPVIFIH